MENFCPSEAHSGGWEIVVTETEMLPFLLALKIIVRIFLFIISLSSPDESRNREEMSFFVR
jgi:hypothetical protein